jgi:putative transposase
MRRKQFSEKQIIGILKDVEAGAVVTVRCRKHGMSSATNYAWKAKFGGLKVSDASTCGRSTPGDVGDERAAGVHGRRGSPRKHAVSLVPCG